MLPVRVLFVIDSIEEHAGTENQIVEWIRRVDRGRIQPYLCCLEDGERMRSLPDCGRIVLPFRRAASKEFLQQVWKLRAYINREKIDVVQGFLVKSTLLGVAAGRLSRCKVILTSRRNIGHGYTPFFLKVFGFLNSQTTRILANSEGARRAAETLESGAKGKVDVLYNGVDVSRFRLASGDGEPLVGMVANYRPVKDIPLFLKAARVVADHVPAARFLLVGRGSLLGELKELTASLGLTERVEFTDGQGRVEDHLTRMSVACLSSSAEGFSNAILEYMAAGLPVVATDVGGNGEAVQQGVTGYIVKERTADAFAAPIVTLLQDEARRREMGRAGRMRVEEEFDLPVSVRRHEDYWIKLVEGCAVRS